MEPYNHREIEYYQRSIKIIEEGIPESGNFHAGAIRNLLLDDIDRCFRVFKNRFLCSDGQNKNSEKDGNIKHEVSVKYQGTFRENNQRIEGLDRVTWNGLNDIIMDYGWDSLRFYSAFAGDVNSSVVWNTDGLDGVYRFLTRIWNFFGDESKFGVSPVIIPERYNIYYKEIEERMYHGKMNTAAASLMSYFAELKKEFKQKGRISPVVREEYLVMLFPFAPYISLCLLKKGNDTLDVNQIRWPKIADTKQYSIPVQINGKFKGLIYTDDLTREQVIMRGEELLDKNDTTEIKNVIYVPGKIVNFIV